ncbi:hypothetical protein [Nisaea sediminum]|uniref:hypothetical protein n=1 Tax=Nisaea sediminum TaxID=2775867 RepID=UPI001867C4D0|nr:hypothetical protein [Nisaea sediminum]
MDKSLSVRIDDTIEGVLRFLLRFFVTYGRVAFLPARSGVLVSALSADPPLYTRPLTFLAIGAFLFSLLIDVYPAGFAGLIDLIWFSDELKVNFSKRWKEALTLTTLITTGLPVIVAVAGLAGASSRLLFKGEPERAGWFAISCYSFGYIIISLFLLMSVETVFDGIAILFPFFKEISVPEPIENILLVICGLLMLLLVLISPMIFLAGAFFSFKGKSSGAERVAQSGFVFIYGVFGVYLISQAASVVPDLSKTYFPDPVPEAMIFEEFKFDLDQDSDALDVSFQVIVENKLNEDHVLELSGHQVQIVLSRSPDELGVESWYADNLVLTNQGATFQNSREIIPKKSNRLVDLKATFPGWSSFYCESRTLIEKDEQEIESGTRDDSYLLLRLRFEPNFRLSLKRIEPTDRMIDHDTLKGIYENSPSHVPC